MSDLSTGDREASEVYLTLPPHIRPVWMRMGVRLANGVSAETAKAKFYAEVAVIERGAS